MNKVDENIYCGKLSPKQEEYVERKMFLQNSFMKSYLDKKISGGCISDLLVRKNISKIALYSVTDFLDFMLEDIKKDGRVKIISLADKRFSSFPEGIKGYPVLCLKDIVNLLNNKEIDAVVVCNYMHEADVIAELMDAGIAQDNIFTIGTLLFFD